jgi:hypothetical protein
MFGTFGRSGMEITLQCSQQGEARTEGTVFDEGSGKLSWMVRRAEESA